MTHEVVRHETPLGTMVSVWTSRGLYRLTWESDASFSADHARSSRSRVLDDRLMDYFRNGGVSFDDIELDMTGITAFRMRVYQSCRQIQAGEIATYARLAQSVDSPQASRAVGAAMAANRVLLVIPCHRVIASDGKLRGFSAAGGLGTKRWLLDWESGYLSSSDENQFLAAANHLPVKKSDVQVERSIAKLSHTASM
jgi:methylated-DNA-[protein]-cysteine S-methyltransferase